MHKNRLAIILTLVLCLLLATACASQGDSDGQGADDQSATAAAAQNPLEGIDADSRVVALTRSVSELWLLSGGQLVGVTDDAFDLSDLSEDVESIGSVSQPSLEQVVALEPDLVMLNDEMPSHKELHASLEGAGIPVLVVDINSFDDYAAVMEDLVACTGRDDLYEKNVTVVRAKIDDILEHGSRRDGDTFVAISTSATENKVLKNDYFACDMLVDFGLTNLADGTSALDDLSSEAIVKADPDWVFVVFQGDDEGALEAFKDAFSSNPAWSELRANKDGHVVMLPKNYFQYWPNAQWNQAYAYLSQILHGSWA